MIDDEQFVGVMQAFERVQGAVGRNDIIPQLMNVTVHSGHVYAFDGRMSLRAPLPPSLPLSALSFTTRAEPLYRALRRCNDRMGAPTIEVNAQDLTLTIRRGKMRIILICEPMQIDTLPAPTSRSGLRITGGDALATALRACAPFVTEDVSRPWANGVWIDGAGNAIATNNVVLIRASTESTSFPPCVVPFYAVEEVAAFIATPGTRVLITGDGSMELLAKDSTFMRTRLIAGEWPRSPGEMLKIEHAGAKCRKIPPLLLEAVTELIPFCPDNKVPIIKFDGTTVRTDAGTQSAEVTDVGGNVGTCRFRAEPLKSMLAIATHADFAKFPRVPFTGDGVDGLLMGMML